MNKKSRELSIPNESLDSYHARNCTICRHPDRAAIEYDFIQWRDCIYIAREFDVPTRSIYRHAHAADLFTRRRANLRSSLELVIENAGRIIPSGDTVLRAIELYARMNDDGQIAGVPKTQHILVSHGAPGDAAQTQITAQLSVPIAQIAPSNADVTPLKAPLLPESEPTPQFRAAFGMPQPDPDPEAPNAACRYQLDTQSQTEFDLSP
jgi:hypothetical protein